MKVFVISGVYLWWGKRSVLDELNEYFGFDSIVCVDFSGTAYKKYRGNNMIKIVYPDYHHDMTESKYCNDTLNEMPPLSSKMIETLSFHIYILYEMLGRYNDIDLYCARNEQVLKHLQYWNHVVDKYDIDLLISFGIPHNVFNYAIYALCEAKKIKTLVMSYALVPGYSYCHDSIYRKFDRLEKTYIELMKENEQYSLSDFMRSYIDKMEFAPVTLPQVSEIELQYFEIMRESEQYSISDLEQLLKDKKKKDSSEPQQALRFWQVIISRSIPINDKMNIARDVARKKVAKASYDPNRYYLQVSKEADFDERFIYVPLQVQPEATTSPFGSIFVNQILMVKILSYCVKDTNIKLYVKEHPSQKFYKKSMKYRRRSFYEDLLSLPNVTLIRKEINSYKLQEHCMAVATVTGTVIMESLFKGKPALVFGNFINNLAPNAYQVSDVKSCEKALDDIINERFFISKKQRDAFLKAVELECFRAYNSLSFQMLDDLSEDENADNILAELKKCIKAWQSEKESS